MFTQIDIGNFGSFNSFVWKNSTKDNKGNIQNFKRLNIIYGRNYSGKTTLSRIFRSLEERKLPANFDSPNFILHQTSGNVTQAQVAGNTDDVRVYNKDFVQDNLGFLVDQQDGEIKTFAIVGAENKELVEEIDKIIVDLGTIESKSGARYDLWLKSEAQQRKTREHNNADEAVAEKLRRHANDVIKQNREYGKANYNIENIRQDIRSIRSSTFVTLTDEDISSKKALLKEEPIPSIGVTLKFSLAFESIKTTTFELLQRKIAPTKAIKDFLNDSVLQSWVRTGLPLHRKKRDICGFCGQTLPADVWQVLDAHFSEESENLVNAIDVSLESIESELNSLINIVPVKETQLYATEKTEFSKELVLLSKNIALYEATLKSIQKSLKDRKSKLFEQVPYPDINVDRIAIAENLVNLNSWITKSDARSHSLATDKSDARQSLLINDVGNFIQQINLSAEEKKVVNLKLEVTNAETTAHKSSAKLKELEKKLDVFKAQQKDERKGAARVNELLNHFFGHDGIRLHALDDEASAGVKFQVMRGAKAAFNLSEGECSLVAFCYFVAKLEESETKGKDLVIYIDDPISSLDANHIFFIFSVIESLIAKPSKNLDGSNRYGYKQLFISTHSLDFLKYLKRLSSPKPKAGGTAHFIIESNGKPSEIHVMPDYLKTYVTEFNYLFHQIYKCRDEELAKTSPESFFSFGNNLRKFLEAYLFYRYPHQEDTNDSLERMNRFFDGDDMAVTLTGRLSNELSHLEHIFDRSMKPVDIPEIPKLATFVLEKLYLKDKDQYNSLLRSIGEPVRET
uniref:Protein CR006 P-loop domain-containing protein n=1 Tax=Polaromonas sp. E10S TaxID=1840239 RepID=A0A2S1FHM5_9BURK|nr:AAA family ATPase [Polaromonas sp. E10S]AWD71955.1 hypothetical protein pE10SP1_p008 [Polaromonas sp. E10S]